MVLMHRLGRLGLEKSLCGRKCLDGVYGEVMLLRLTRMA